MWSPWLSGICQGMIRISVLTPSYNQARFIRRTIESVQSQSGPFELEHIIVDGGSDDGTPAILDSYGSAVRWISEADDGQADAMNKAQAMATGDVVGWLNSDDLYQSGALATVAGVFENEPATMWLYGKVTIVDEHDREIRRWITAYKNRQMRRFSLGRLLAENWISQPGVFWRRSAAEKVGAFRSDLHYCMDYDYWLRLAKRWPGHFVDIYLAAFRWHAGSKSGGGFVEQFVEGLNVAREIAAGAHPWAICTHRLNRIKITGAYRLMQMARNWSPRRNGPLPA
ncbi:hypothetical protein LCGC14_0274720 [marine sediment metagenome]|uniref:Glycosyltransferase 2-like domain-containing protein n=1 Tax=marine sediment metagenome TaxID=412755 RepID=A0A0F9U2T3_9ZZZZ